MRPTTSLRRVALTTAPLLLLAGIGSLPAAAATPTCFGKAATIIGTAAGDSITGTAGNDVISAGDGNDTVHGGGGNDLICGGSGDDVLYGDAGTNKLDGGDGNDNLSSAAVFVGGTGIYDTALFADLPATTPVTVDLTAGTAVAGGTRHTLTGVEGVVGTAGNDVLRGSAGNDLLYGVGGDDTIDGRGGVDYAGFLTAGVTASLVTGRSTGEGTDTLAGLEGLLGGSYPSTLTGDDLPNLILGGSADDIIHGGGGADLLAGGKGSDTLYGEAGDDQLLGQGGDDIISGGDGFDSAAYYTATAGVSVSLATNRSSGIDGVDVLGTVEGLMGSDLNDVLTGNTHSNWLAGLGGNDRLVGGSGDDFLDGGPGTDSASAGAGRDACTAAETMTACETIGAAPASAAGVVRGLASTMAVTAGQLPYGYIDRQRVPVRCDQGDGYSSWPTVYVQTPEVYAVYSNRDDVTWTPYLEQWNGAAWVQVAQADSYGTSAYPYGSGGSEIYGRSYFLQSNYFSVPTPGYYQVWDLVTWNAAPGVYAWQAGGMHILQTYSLLNFPSATTDPWCKLDSAQGGKAAVTTAPPVAGVLPPPPSVVARRPS